MSVAHSRSSLSAASREQFLFEALHEGTQAVRQFLHSEVRERGLTLCQFWTLHHIAEGGPTTASRIAANDGVTPASVSITVDQLVPSGLVERRRQEDDRRVVVLKATARGDQLLEQVWRRGARTLAELTAEVPKADLETTARVLRQLKTTVFRLDAGARELAA